MSKRRRRLLLLLMCQGVENWLQSFIPSTGSIYWCIIFFPSNYFKNFVSNLISWKVFVSMICLWRPEHISGPHPIHPTQQHLLPVKICSVDSCISSLVSSSFLATPPPHTHKKKPPAGCSCFVGPGAMLQTHTTVKLSSLPAAGMSSPHHHFLGSKFTHKRWGYHRLTIYITGHVWLSEERGGEQKWLVFAKVQQNRKNKAELMPHKEVLICAAHMNTAGSTKLSQ